MRWPYLNAPTAPTDERDLAAAAVRVLCEDGHSGAEYILTGPQSLTQAEQAHTIGRALARSLRVEEMSPDEARSELLPVLGSPILVNMLLNAWAAAVGQPAFVTSTFAELTGAPPRTFLEWATDHAADPGMVRNATAPDAEESLTVREGVGRVPRFSPRKSSSNTTTEPASAVLIFLRRARRRRHAGLYP